MNNYFLLILALEHINYLNKGYHILLVCLVLLVSSTFSITQSLDKKKERVVATSKCYFLQLTDGQTSNLEVWKPRNNYWNLPTILIQPLIDAWLYVMSQTLKTSFCQNIQEGCQICPLHHLYCPCPRICVFLLLFVCFRNQAIL